MVNQCHAIALLSNANTHIAQLAGRHKGLNILVFHPRLKEVTHLDADVVKDKVFLHALSIGDDELYRDGAHLAGRHLCAQG